MRIRRLELTNFRTFGHAVFEDIPETVLLVSPNGRGKSSVLEAIAGAKDLVTPYHQDHYQFSETWPPLTWMTLSNSISSGLLRHSVTESTIITSSHRRGCRAEAERIEGTTNVN